MKSKSKKILVVEDHPIFRMGLKALIENEPDMTVCADALDVDTAFDLVETHDPDLVVVDLSLQDSNGMDLIRRIGDTYRNLPCLVLSMHDESVHAERCIIAGARGYLMKQEASESVITAIRDILSGQIHVSRKIMSQILGKFKAQPSLAFESPLKQLTDRELEIFQLIGRGVSSKDMAAKLSISVKTIGTYRERIKEKLGYPDSGALVRNAVIWVETGALSPG